MEVNPYLFFLLKDGQFIVWDYLHHRQFIIEYAYFERLQQWSHHQQGNISIIDQELIDAQLLIPKQQYPSWGWDELAQIYHIGTKNIADKEIMTDRNQWLNHYLTHCTRIAKSTPQCKVAKEGRKFSLPQANFSFLDHETLLNALMARKTCRSFNHQPVNLEILSILLYVSLGPIHELWSELEDNDLQILGRRKSYPSAGGIHPEESYLVVLKVSGLQSGVYYYNSFDHDLMLIQENMDEQDLMTILHGQYFVEGIAFGIILTASFDKLWWKYPHSRAYRMVYLDIGHASQTLLLTATALGLSTWMTGAFSETQLEHLLKLANTWEQPLFFLGFGYGDNQFLDQQTLLTLNQA